MSEDNILLVLLKKGNRDAFNALFEKYSPRLYFFTQKSFRNKVDAEEIVQDTFLKLWETRHRIDPTLPFNTYVIAIAKNLIYDLLRHKVVARKYSDHMQRSSSGSYSIEHELALKNLTAYVTTHIERLPVQQKEILLLKSKGYDNDEIARQLRLSKRTVETHINRAFKFLRSSLVRGKEVFSVVILFCTKYIFS